MTNKALTLGSLYPDRRSNPIEEWRPVPGYEGYYSISSYGRVWSWVSGKFLKPANYHGYLHCCLTNGSGKRWHRIHRLVAEAFIPNPDRKPTVNHMNEDKEDKARVVDGMVMAVGVDIFNEAMEAQALYHLEKDDWKVWLRIQR